LRSHLTIEDQEKFLIEKAQRFQEKQKMQTDKALAGQPALIA